MRLRVPDISAIKDKMKSIQRRREFTPRAKRGAQTGRLFAIIRPAWIASAVAALLISFFAAKAVEGFLLTSMMETQKDLSKAVNSRPPSVITMQSQKKLGSEVSFTPFDTAARPKPKETSKEQKAIDTFTLAGTLPNIGAWLSEGDDTTLVLQAQSFNGYVLELVDAGLVLFSKDGDSYPLYLKLGGPSTGKNAKPAPRRAVPPPAPPQQTGNPGIIPATDGNPGSISREILDSVLANPLDEMKKVNLTPDGSGMRLLRVNDKSSFLAQMGVQAGDVMTSINGVKIDNMANVGNAITSMLGSNQFNLEITRDSKPLKLDYNVK